LDDCATDLVENDETVWETIPTDALTSDLRFRDRAAFLQVRKQSYPVVSMTPLPESLLAAIYFNSLNNTRFGEWKANTIALSSTAGADLFPKTVQKVQTLAAQFESSKLQSSSSFQQKQGNNGQNQHVHANAAYHHQGKRGAPGQGGGQSKKFAGSKQCEICKNNNKKLHLALYRGMPQQGSQGAERDSPCGNQSRIRKRHPWRQEIVFRIARQVNHGK